MFESFFAFRALSKTAQTLVKQGLNPSLSRKGDAGGTRGGNFENSLFRFGEPGFAEKIFLRFAAAFPEIFGRAETRAVKDFLLSEPEKSSVSPVADKLPDNVRQDHLNVLRAAYAAAKRIDGKNKNTKAVSFVEDYERFAAAVLDLRLEGAALERVKDAFYEDGRFATASPDWINTSENILTLESLPPDRLLRESDEPEQTVRLLADFLTVCVLEHGFFPLFDPDEWRIDGENRPFLRKCFYFVILSPDERRFLNALVHAMAGKDFSGAAKIMFRHKTLPLFFPLSELSGKLERLFSRMPESLSAGLDVLFEYFAENGITLPSNFHLLRSSFDFFETFAVKTAGSGVSLWSEAAKTAASYEPYREDASSAADFLEKGTEVPELHMLSRKVRGKPFTNFIKDKSQIPEMLKRAEAGYGFRPRPFKIDKRIAIPLLALAVLVLSLLLF